MTEMKPGDFAAFPIQSSDAQGSLYAEQGLTKREYIAAVCLQGILGDPQCDAGPGTAANLAIKYADALLAALTPTSEAKPGDKHGT